MENDLIRVGLRARALFIDHKESPTPKVLTASTINCLKQLLDHGFTLTEKALRQFNTLEPEVQSEYLRAIGSVYNTEFNWTPLVRGWLEPTGETAIDHLLTLFSNLSDTMPGHGTLMPCGHVIPDGTFPIERYTGCPFCGKPFEFSNEIYKGGITDNIKELDLWTSADARGYLLNLLQSSVPLDATAIDSLKILLEHYYLGSGVEVKMKETLVVVVDFLLENRREVEANSMMSKSPADILRYLWYKKTGQLQIIEPHTLIRKTRVNYSHLVPSLSQSLEKGYQMEQLLKLKYDREWCRRVAGWMNSLSVSAERAAQIMHPKRGMWVRFIRALRLSEYARRKDFGNLRRLLDVFYNRRYIVPQGLIDRARRKDDVQTLLDVLSGSPGLYSRQLFSNMLKFGPEYILENFAGIIDKLPTRLMVSLGNYADYYFMNDQDTRRVRTITGITYQAPVNPLLSTYPLERRGRITGEVYALSLQALVAEYAKSPEPGRKVYISSDLDNIVLPVGDRSQTIQDVSSVLQGTCFAVKGDSVRLFVHWGKGMPAQPLDIDLSASIVYDDRVEQCAYFNLAPAGARHSGDIRMIPDNIGTAEYIELDIPVLLSNGARFVTFYVCNYSGGSVSSQTLVGWMNAANPMKVSDETGVAFNPAAVQHMVRIPDALMSRGLVFGVLELQKRSIIWLEQQSNAQTVMQLDADGVRNYLSRLSNKISVGQALRAMAEARGWEIVPEADASLPDVSVFDTAWAADIPAVTSLLL